MENSYQFKDRNHNKNKEENLKIKNLLIGKEV